MAISKFYSRQGLWTLFLMSALPLHLWALFLGFRDFDWISARTNSWDAVGVVSYGLLFAVIESVFVFLIACLLGFLISTKWGENRRIALMSTLLFILAIWSAFNQSYFINELSPPNWLVDFASGTGRPLVALYTMALAAVGLSFTVPAYFILKSNRFLQGFQEAMDRLSLLMTLYLVLDAAAIIIIFIRNL